MLMAAGVDLADKRSGKRKWRTGCRI